MHARRSFARRLVEHLLVLLGILAVLVAASGTALAQAPPTTDQGPRFGQWGPGLAPPEPEGPAGPDVAGPRAPGAAPEAPAPLYAPPGPADAPAPERWGGCNYDLRGSWQVTGRQTEPYPYAYTARIHVRQFRQWLQIDQPDDGVSYYGVCRGDTIELDVYLWGRFVGYQDGVISAGWGGPWAPGRGLRVRAEWVMFAPGHAAGYEIWRRGYR
ncbi:MAG TPA: hypothetical protein VFB73_02320 [Chloroflexota bacterium]|nr:hypothetical protein [Chloroflexota bacterium]